MILWLAACAEVVEDPVPLVLADAWELGDLGDDPLADHQPRDPWCPPGTWGFEDGRLEVQTGACDYAWLVQPAKVALEPGAALRLLTWHQGLDAAEPAEAHFAFVVDGEVWWETWTAIPALPEVFDTTLAAPERVPEGARVGLHLHNHGFNSWQVAEISRL